MAGHSQRPLLNLATKLQILCVDMYAPHTPQNHNNSMCIHGPTHMYMRTGIGVHICTHVCMWVYTYLTHTHTYLPRGVYRHICVCVYLHIYTCTSMDAQQMCMYLCFIITKPSWFIFLWLQCPIDLWIIRSFHSIISLHCENYSRPFLRFHVSRASNFLLCLTGARSPLTAAADANPLVGLGTWLMTPHEIVPRFNLINAKSTFGWFRYKIGFRGNVCLNFFLHAWY